MYIIDILGLIFFVSLVAILFLSVGCHEFPFLLLVQFVNYDSGIHTLNACLLLA